MFQCSAICVVLFIKFVHSQNYYAIHEGIENIIKTSQWKIILVYKLRASASLFEGIFRESYHLFLWMIKRAKRAASMWLILSGYRQMHMENRRFSWYIVYTKPVVVAVVPPWSPRSMIIQQMNILQQMLGVSVHEVELHTCSGCLKLHD